MSTGSKIQRVYASNSPIQVTASDQVAVPLYYSVGTDDANLSGLTLNVHYNSSLLGLISIEEMHSEAITQVTTLDDVDNKDKDDSTDSILQLLWVSFDSSFPGGSLPADLGKLVLTPSFTRIQAATDSLTTIRFTSDETASDYTFDSDPIVFLARENQSESEGYASEIAKQFTPDENPTSTISIDPPTDTVVELQASTWSDSVRINRVVQAARGGGRIEAEQVTEGRTGSVLRGSDNDDILQGKAGWDIFDGRGGNDFIRAGNGRDIITGGLGSDEIWGDLGWNTYTSEKDGDADLIVIKSDQFLLNPLLGKAGNNPDGAKSDIIEGLDTIDRIRILGVRTEDLTFRDNVTTKGVTGIGIYGGGYLEALYIGGDLTVSQITAMTSGDASPAAMANQISSYGWTENPGELPSENQSENPASAIVSNYITDESESVGVDLDDLSILAKASTWSGSIQINRVVQAAANGGEINAEQTLEGGVGSVLRGSNSNDVLRGRAGWDIFDGRGGNDFIRAGNGRDIITGGLGSDEIWGDLGWNTYTSEKDGDADLIVIKSDQFLLNPLLGKAGNNPDGAKSDIIEGLDTIDRIRILGVRTEDLTFRDNVTTKGVTGIGIYGGGYLEALYIGGDLTVSQITAMTSGDASPAAMANQIFSYDWTRNPGYF